MRLKLLLAALLTLLPVPALADVTARYKAGDTSIVIEAADNGDSRFQIESPMKVTIMRHGGVDYVVMRDPGGVDRVTLAREAFASLIGQMPPPGGKDTVFETSTAGADTLAGYSGTVWRYGPRGEAPLELLMSPDPRLARVGDVFRSVIELVIGASGSMLGPYQLRQMFAAGTPIRISEVRTEKPQQGFALESVSMDPIDPARFALPGPVMPAKDFIALVSPPGEKHTVTIEVPNQ